MSRQAWRDVTSLGYTTYNSLDNSGRDKKEAPVVEFFLRLAVLLFILALI